MDILTNEDIQINIFGVHYVNYIKYSDTNTWVRNVNT